MDLTGKLRQAKKICLECNLNMELMIRIIQHISSFERVWPQSSYFIQDIFIFSFFLWYLIMINILISLCLSLASLISEDNFSIFENLNNLSRSELSATEVSWQNTDKWWTQVTSNHQRLWKIASEVSNRE